ncbi:MAG TPA: nuclease-related domain-containing protein [Verrucomicrobiae bacterium]|nr:nuclease-related domain-containing protein [Verrucomicrobiae bacterium]
MELLRVVCVELIPIGVLFLYLLFRQWQRRREGVRPPIQEKLLRPAGYTLQCKIDKLNDHVNTLLLIVIACSVSSGLVFMNRKAMQGSGVLVAALAAVAGVSIGKIIGSIEQLRSYHLGLLGEQAMGEQLQTLALQGYRIFHDIPGNGLWNIDHVAVGSGGIFAIETKCYSKKPSRNGRKDHEAEFNGEVIRFPWGDDAGAPIQARAAAKWLGNFLSSAVGERVATQPIVALPGWYVTLKANSDLKVLSGKQVPGYINSMPEILTPKLIQQIAHQLDQRCRTVEF